MKLSNLFAAAAFAAIAMVGTADAQLVLAPNGDFGIAAGDQWNQFNSAGTAVSYETAGGTGGAADGFGRVDNTAGAWGGGLVAEGGTGPAPAGSGGIPLGDLGLTAGTAYDVQLDMRDLVGTGFGTAGVNGAGIKMESWSETGVINDSGDQYFAITGAWATYSYNYTIDPAATRIKFVPLLVNQQTDAGFDNVGIVVPAAVPEPSSLALISLGIAGLAARRRRRS